jgi:hypothetical protein
MILKTIIKKLFGANKLSNLELLILCSVREKLQADLQYKWDEQIKAINKIQRLPKGVEVDFYRLKNGRPSFDENLTFENKQEELKLASVKIEFPDKTCGLCASVWCVSGFLFSIEYEGNTKRLEKELNRDPAIKLMIETQLLTDLSTKNK